MLLSLFIINDWWYSTTKHNACIIVILTDLIYVRRHVNHLDTQIYISTNMERKIQ